MLRRASRLTLRLTDAQVGRVQEISEEDAKAEGLWVWVLSFELIRSNVDDVLKYSTTENGGDRRKASPGTAGDDQ